MTPIDHATAPELSEPAADPYFAGQQSYWAGKRRRVPADLEPSQSERWCAGWDAGAMEASNVLRQTRAVQAYAKTIRDTIYAAGLVLRRIDRDWAYKPIGIKASMADVRIAINNCLVHLPELEAAAGTLHSEAGRHE